MAEKDNNQSLAKQGANNSCDTALKAAMLAITHRNDKIVECNGMYDTTPSGYNRTYESKVYDCSVYEKQ